MVENICNNRRGKVCYFLFALSIFFFISSVLVFTALAITKTEDSKKEKIIIIDKKHPSINVEQRRIIKRLKRLEERIEKGIKNEQ